MTTNEELPVLRTRAEATDYEETSRHDDVLRFCRELAEQSDLVHLGTMGQSGEGQDMAVLVVSDRGAFSPEEARRQKKVVVLVEANIHAGEVEGKESVLALARDLVLGEHGKAGARILANVCLVLIPDFNPDGNDRISPKNRALDLAQLEGQVNPAGGVGTRYTGEGWNLNRDAMKQEAIETRNLAKLFQHWQPHLFIDCHTTDGSIHACDLTFDTSHSNQQVFSKLLGVTGKMLESVGERIEERYGFHSAWYGNWAKDDEPSTGWHTYPALPRFGSHYRGLLGVMDVLLETYSYIDFRRRCEVMYAWLYELVRHASRNRKELVRAVEREQERIVARGLSLDPRPTIGVNYGVARRGADGAIAFDYPAYAFDGDEATVEGWDLDSTKAHRFPGVERRRWRVPHKRTFVPTVAVSTPAAYVVTVPVAERLRAHGIEVEALEGETRLAVESYTILSSEKTFSPDVAAAVPPPGEAEVPLSHKPPPKRFETVLSVRPERREATFPAGTHLVRTAQKAGTLAVYLLEPCSDDGLVRWEFLDRWLEVGKLYPIHRVVAPLEAPTRKAE